VGLFPHTRAHFWKLDEPPLYKTAYHFESTGQRAAISAFSFAGSFWVAATLVTFHWINKVVGFGLQPCVSLVAHISQGLASRSKCVEQLYPVHMIVRFILPAKKGVTLPR
jgi:hypothetical protein